MQVVATSVRVRCARASVEVKLLFVGFSLPPVVNFADDSKEHPTISSIQSLRSRYTNKCQGAILFSLEHKVDYDLSNNLRRE